MTTLFEYQAEAAASTRVRASDPATSQQAAATTAEQLAPARAEVLLEIGWFGGTGANREDVANLLGKDRSCVSRRITDLCQMGLVADSGRTEVGKAGRPLTLWVLTDQGRIVWRRIRAEHGLTEPEFA